MTCHERSDQYWARYPLSDFYQQISPPLVCNNAIRCRVPLSSNRVGIENPPDPTLGTLCRTVWLLMLSDEADNSPPSLPFITTPVCGDQGRDGSMQPCPRPSINYHHHLFYIREPFVTKKGILTVCLMGETFKLEQASIYHTTRPSQISCWRDNPISTI